MFLPITQSPLGIGLNSLQFYWGEKNQQTNPNQNQLKNKTKTNKEKKKNQQQQNTKKNMT